MGFMYEFPHTTQFDSDLREIIEMYIKLVCLPDRMEEFEKLINGEVAGLKEFVNNYFNNLDVQTEINNKIDSMVYIFRDVVYADSIGLVKFDTLVEAQAATETVGSDNSAIIERILKSGMKFQFGIGYYPFSREINIENDVTISGNRSGLVFHTSKGIVFDREYYYSNIVIENINIFSNGSCISAINAVCKNIYWSTFRNLVLESENGNCIESAYRNLSVSGDLIMFQNYFDNIRIKAPNGAGFANINGLQNVFNNISDSGRTLNTIFLNCDGVFSNCNFSFADANYGLFFDANFYKFGDSIVLTNCNFEKLKKGIIGYSGNQCNFALSVRNVSWLPHAGFSPYTTYPISLFEITKLEYINNNISISNYYENVNSIFSVNDYKGVKDISTDENISFTDTSGTRLYNERVAMVPSPTLTDWNKAYYPKYNEVHANRLYGDKLLSVLTVTEAVDIIGSNTDNNCPDVINLNFGIEHTIRNIDMYEQLPGRIITLNNISTYNVVVDKSWFDTFIFKNGNTYTTLTPNNSISFIRKNVDGVLKWSEL